MPQAAPPRLTTATNDLSRALRADIRGFNSEAIADLEARIETLLAQRREEVKQPGPTPAGDSPFVRAAQGVLAAWALRWQSRAEREVSLPPRVERALQGAGRTAQLGANRNILSLGIVPGANTYEQSAVGTQADILARGIVGRRSATIGQLEELSRRAMVAGMSPSEAFELIGKLAASSDRRSRFQARDLVGNLVAEITQATYQSVGVEEFIWRTQGDSRVRPEHRELAGKKFPISTGAPGVGLPGQPPGCRCWAEPIRKDGGPLPEVQVVV